MSSPSSSEPDQELKQAFVDLQTKMQSTHQSIKIFDIQISSLKRQIAYAEVTDKAVQNVPDGTRLYSGVGRMFLLSDAPTLRSDLTSNKKKAEEKIQTLEKNKQYLKKSLKDSENNLRDLVKQKQGVTVS